LQEITSALTEAANEQTPNEATMKPRGFTDGECMAAAL
jgi:hypothetical protein